MDEDTERLLGETIAKLKRELIELGCRVRELQVASAVLGQKVGIPPDKIYMLLEARAKRAVEKKLLDIGETNPHTAELLGIEDFLRELDRPNDTT